MVLLAGFQALLGRCCGQGDLVVGMPIPGGTRPEFEGLIGFFVNTLAIRTDLAQDSAEDGSGCGLVSFRTLLSRVRSGTLSAYAHQEVPFEKVVEEVHPVRDLSREPIFQVSFDFENVPPFVTCRLAGLKVEKSSGRSMPRVRCDLETSLVSRRSRTECPFEFRVTARICSPLLRSPASRLTWSVFWKPPSPRRTALWGDLDLLSDAERHQLLVEWNDTQVDYGPSAQRCIHQLFEEQACIPQRHRPALARHRRGGVPDVDVP